MTRATPEFSIEPLQQTHSLEGFDCGQETLNDWLRRFAWTNQKADSTRTYVAVRNQSVAGYYALTTGSVHRHESPRRIAQGLAGHPIGVVLLARLAVDRECQGFGLGKAL